MTTNAAQIGWTREDMARRLALDIPNGSYVNLGIGIPELVARFVPEGRTLIYHTENGLLGMGPAPKQGAGDPELINAGKQQVTALPGAAYFHHADSFAMIPAGHRSVRARGHAGRLQRRPGQLVHRRARRHSRRRRAMTWSPASSPSMSSPSTAPRTASPSSSSAAPTPSPAAAW